MNEIISVIVCSRNERNKDHHRRHVGLTIGCANEYIRIDNTHNEYSLTSAYNKGIAESKGDICVFVHEDVFFLTPAWGRTLRKKFIDHKVGIVGLAGSQLQLARPSWSASGPAYIKGQVLHEDEEKMFASVWDRSIIDWHVSVVDGLFISIRKDLLFDIHFDETNFDGFHFYDLDICMQARQTHSILVACDILVKHYSQGAWNEEWKRYAIKFLNKYRNQLPGNQTVNKLVTAGIR